MPPFMQIRQAKLDTGTEATTPALSEAQQQEHALVQAAVFSQAVAELQHVGLCRPSKRRKGAAVQRLYYPPESLLG